jgi:peptide subunit release factor 1 (eRF1)
VRLLDWSLGAMRQLDDWEITLWSLDWRERKAERSLPGPQGWTSASGHDQFDQRLDANRRRFLREVGGHVREQWGAHKWSYVLAIGAEDQAAELAEGLADEAKRLHTAVHDLISAKEHDVAQRVEAEVRAINERHAQELLRELEEAIGAAPGAALGPQETLEALAEGRVRHLVFDADRDHDGQPLEANLSYDDGSEDGVPVSERLVELAVATAAAVTPLRGDAAAKLQPHGGVAALLRY